MKNLKLKVVARKAATATQDARRAKVLPPAQTTPEQFYSFVRETVGVSLENAENFVWMTVASSVGGLRVHDVIAVELDPAGYYPGCLYLASGGKGYYYIREAAPALPVLRLATVNGKRVKGSAHRADLSLAAPSDFYGVVRFAVAHPDLVRGVN